jgi:hypothetical protein
MGGKGMMVVGGMKEGYKASAAAEFYDPKAQSWSRLARMSVQRNNACAGTLLLKLPKLSEEESRVMVHEGRPGPWRMGGGRGEKTEAEKAASAAAKVLEKEAAAERGFGVREEKGEKEDEAGWEEEGYEWREVVVVVGGMDATNTALASAEYFDPLTSKWAPLPIRRDLQCRSETAGADMSVPRVGAGCAVIR